MTPGTATATLKMTSGSDQALADGVAGLVNAQAAQVVVCTLTPRVYQLELLEYARKSNVIAYLDTGAGKTYISVMLVKDRILPAQASGKPLVAIFLCPKVSLVFQLRLVELLIFDECHHCKGNDPYNCIMREFYHDPTLPANHRPHIFGMTASPVNVKGRSNDPERVGQQICELERRMACRVVTVVNRKELEEAAPAPETVVLRYEAPMPGLAVQAALQHMERAYRRLKLAVQYAKLEVRMRGRRAARGEDGVGDGDAGFMWFEEGESGKTALERLANLLGAVHWTLLELGPWCAAAALAEVLSPAPARMLMYKLMDGGASSSMGRADGDGDDCKLTGSLQLDLTARKLQVEQELAQLSDGGELEGHGVVLERQAVEVSLVEVVGAVLDLLVEEKERRDAFLQEFRGVVRKSIDQKLGRSNSRLCAVIKEVMAAVPKSVLQEQALLEQTPAAEEWQDTMGCRLVTSKVSTLVCELVRHRAACMASKVTLPAEIRRVRLWTDKVERVVSAKLNLATLRHWSGIVFVDRKMTALTLDALLKALPCFDFLSTAPLTGFGGVLAASSLDYKEQTTVLRKFRYGVFNCLLSTSVAEEGLDLKSCQLVVRFDLPKTALSFIQSRGRARMRNSSIALMVEAGNFEHQQAVKKLEWYEEQMRAQAVDRAERLKAGEEEETRESDGAALDRLLASLPLEDVEYVVPATGAKVTIASAKMLLAFYCSRLPSDSFVNLKPRFSPHETTEGVHGYVCSVNLPNNCPVHHVHGRPMPRKGLAMQSAALEACRELHQAGELDSHLLPKDLNVLEVENYGDDEEGEFFAHARGKTAAGKKKVYRWRHPPSSYVQQAIPDQLCLPGSAASVLDRSDDAALREFHLYAFEVHRDTPQADGREPLQTFGLLLQQELPDLPRFPMYLRDGSRVHIHITHGGMLAVAPSQLGRLQVFHRVIVQHVYGGKGLDMRLEEARHAPVIRLRLTPGNNNRIKVHFKINKYAAMMLERKKGASKDEPTISFSELMEGFGLQLQTFSTKVPASHQVPVMQTSPDKSQPLSPPNGAAADGPAATPAADSSADPRQLYVSDEQWALSGHGAWYMLVPIRPNHHPRKPTTPRTAPPPTPSPQQPESAPQDPLEALLELSQAAAPPRLQPPEDPLSGLWDTPGATPAADPTEELWQSSEPVAGSKQPAAEPMNPPKSSAGGETNKGSEAGKEAAQGSTGTWDVAWDIVVGMEAGPRSVKEVMDQGAYLDREGGVEGARTDARWHDANRELAELLGDSIIITNYNQWCYTFSSLDTNLVLASPFPTDEHKPKTRTVVTVDPVTKRKIMTEVTRDVFGSYLEYYERRYEAVGLAPMQPLAECRRAFKLRGWNMLVPPEHRANKRRRKEEEREQEQAKGIKRPVHLVPQLCSLHPLRLAVWRALEMLPCMIFRLESLLGAVTLRNHVMPPEIPPEHRPSIWDVLEASTTLSCQEPFDMERYEVLGDSFLKYAASHFLFKLHPREHEGTLSIKKHLMVSNGILARIARSSRWRFGDYIRVMPYHLGRWTPPGLEEVPEIGTREARGKVFADMMEGLIGIFFQRAGLYGAAIFLEHMSVLPAGSTALISAKPDHLKLAPGTIKSMFSNSLGGGAPAAAVPESDSGAVFTTRHHDSTIIIGGGPSQAANGRRRPRSRWQPCALLSRDGIFTWHYDVDCEVAERPHAITLEDIASPVKAAGPEPAKKGAGGRGQGRDKAHALLEAVLGYEFQEPKLADEAMTHCSWPEAYPPCYQRLEFLGDAVLDLLLLQHIFALYTESQPEMLARLKEAAVNNERLARIAAVKRLHKHLRHNSPVLFSTITGFVGELEDGLEMLRSSGALEGKSRAEMELWMTRPTYGEGCLTAPKALGDLVESLCGAVFIDCGYDLPTIWRVMEPLMQPMVRPQDVPTHPVRELFERLSELGLKAEFTFEDLEEYEDLLTEGEHVSCTVLVSTHPISKCPEADSRRTARKLAAVDALTRWDELLPLLESLAVDAEDDAEFEDEFGVAERRILEEGLGPLDLAPEAGEEGLGLVEDLVEEGSTYRREDDGGALDALEAAQEQAVGVLQQLGHLAGARHVTVSA